MAATVAGLMTSLGSEAPVRLDPQRPLSPQLVLPQRRRDLTPLDLALGTVVAEMARQIVRIGLRILLK
jgi:hypothetical protein